MNVDAMGTQELRALVKSQVESIDELRRWDAALRLAVKAMRRAQGALRKARKGVNTPTKLDEVRACVIRAKRAEKRVDEILKAQTEAIPWHHAHSLMDAVLAAYIMGGERGERLSQAGAIDTAREYHREVMNRLLYGDPDDYIQDFYSAATMRDAHETRPAR